ncbi:MAG: hypothetical protein WAZ18_00735 [Alphaproteobacteria bacterium]
MNTRKTWRDYTILTPVMLLGGFGMVASLVQHTDKMKATQTLQRAAKPSQAFAECTKVHGVEPCLDAADGLLMVHVGTKICAQPDDKRKALRWILAKQMLKAQKACEGKSVQGLGL